MSADKFLNNGNAFSGHECAEDGADSDSDYKREQITGAKGHPLENRKEITLKEAVEYPQIMFSRTSGFRNLQEQFFAGAGIEVKPVCSAEEIEVVAGLVENGFGISVLPYMDTGFSAP